MSLITKPNAWVAVDVDSATTLTYAPRVDPAPLTVSVPGREVKLGSLIVVITNETPDDVAIASVTFTIVVGQPGKEGSPLTPTTKGVKTEVSDTTTWSFTGPSSVIASGTADYVLAPATGGSATLPAGESLYVQIYDFQTVTTPSTSTITIEEALAGVDPQFTSFSVSTFPDGFFFDSLIPTVQSGSALVPVAQVMNGSTVTLTWNSSVVDVKAQTVYYSSASAGQQTANPSVLGEWTSPPLTSDTVFAVSVVAQSTGGEPLTAALQTEVAVQNPALVAGSITTGTATVTGNETIGGSLTANGITATGVEVNGSLTANGASVSGALRAGSATVNGPLTAGATTVNGALSASSASLSGNVQAGSLTTGSATVMSGLNAKPGPVSLVTGAQQIGAGTYRANTDGFAIGVVGWPSSTSPGCVGYAVGTGGGMTLLATGGNLGAFGPLWSDYQASNGNSFVLPVAAGASYGLAASQCDGGLQQAAAPIWFYWVPLGTAPSGVPTTERIGDPPDDLLPPLMPQPSDPAGAEEVVALLEPLLAKPLEGDAREKLIDALRRV
jgi:hypothetical protein